MVAVGAGRPWPANGPETVLRPGMAFAGELLSADPCRHRRHLVGQRQAPPPVTEALKQCLHLLLLSDTCSLSPALPGLRV